MHVSHLLQGCCVGGNDLHSLSVPVNTQQELTHLCTEDLGVTHLSWSLSHPDSLSIVIWGPHLLLIRITVTCIYILTLSTVMVGTLFSYGRQRKIHLFASEPLWKSIVCKWETWGSGGWKPSRGLWRGQLELAPPKSRVFFHRAPPPPCTCRSCRRSQQ